MNTSVVGLTDTLRKYYGEQSKSKRRKLNNTSREQAIQQFVELNATMALSNASLTRTHKICIQGSGNKAKESAIKEAEQTEQQNEDAKATDDEPKDESSEYLDLAEQDNEAMQQRERTVAAEMKTIESARKQVYQDQVELWGVYKYGLQHVKELTDLSAAPDAILPGNFPE